MEYFYKYDCRFNFNLIVSPLSLCVCVCVCVCVIMYTHTLSLSLSLFLSFVGVTGNRPAHDHFLHKMKSPAQTREQSLEENNIQIYLLAVQATAVFFTKALWYDTVLDALPTLLKAVIMRTADSNTRVRKKSVDLINQVWEANPP